MLFSACLPRSPTLQCHHNGTAMQAEPHQFNISLIGEQQVLGLEIAVDNALTVQVLKRLYHTRHAEPRGHIVKITPAKKHNTQSCNQIRLRMNVSA